MSLSNKDLEIEKKFFEIIDDIQNYVYAQSEKSVLRLKLQTKIQMFRLMYRGSSSLGTEVCDRLENVFNHLG